VPSIHCQVNGEQRGFDVENPYEISGYLGLVGVIQERLQRLGLGHFELGYLSSDVRKDVVSDSTLRVALLSGQPLVASILPGKLKVPIVRISQNACDFLLVYFVQILIFRERSQFFQ
jgi:hypothetical protein